MKSWVASRRTSCAVIAGLIVLWPFVAAQACGPFFESDVFVRVDVPDDLGAFVHGKLGILQAGYDSDEYAVAYRYLNGGKLSEKEVGAIVLPGGGEVLNNAQWHERQQARRDAQPPSAWLTTRAEYTTDLVPAKEQSYPTDYEGMIVFDPNYVNCPDGAFQNAALTL